MKHGKVASFEPANSLGYPNWWIMHLENWEPEDENFLVSNNCMERVTGKEGGKLAPGDLVEFDYSPYITYSYCPYKMVIKLQRKNPAKEAVISE